MNKDYGRLENGELIYAPAALQRNGTLCVNPSSGSYLASGWKKIVDNPPQVPYELCNVATGWEEGATTISRVYTQTPRLHPDGWPRTLSKLKLIRALKKRDLWVLVKTWLEERSLYDFFLAARQFVEDDPSFIEGKKGLLEYTSKTEEDAEEIILEAIAK